MPQSSESRGEQEIDELIAEICGPDGCGVNPHILEKVLTLGVEIAREGREGHKVGTLFVIGDAEAVMKASRPMILDPLKGHSSEALHIDDTNMRETIKELAQLDGGFVVTDRGVVRSASRYFNSSSEGIELPLGLGSRHMAAASISRETGAVSVAVSESSVVRVFDEGEILSEIIPELWMIRRHRPTGGETVNVQRKSAGRFLSRRGQVGLQNAGGEERADQPGKPN